MNACMLWIAMLLPIHPGLPMIDAASDIAVSRAGPIDGLWSESGRLLVIKLHRCAADAQRFDVLRMPEIGLVRDLAYRDTMIVRLRRTIVVPAQYESIRAEIVRFPAIATVEPLDSHTAWLLRNDHQHYGKGATARACPLRGRLPIHRAESPAHE
jgi:hypothetical protein